MPFLAPSLACETSLYAAWLARAVCRLSGGVAFAAPAGRRRACHPPGECRSCEYPQDDNRHRRGMLAYFIDDPGALSGGAETTVALQLACQGFTSPSRLGGKLVQPARGRLVGAIVLDGRQVILGRDRQLNGVATQCFAWRSVRTCSKGMSCPLLRMASSLTASSSGVSPSNWRL